MPWTTAWCGALDEGSAVDLLLSPCGIETSSTAILVVLLIVMLAWHSARLRRPAGSIGVVGWTGLEAGTFVACLFLAMLHSAHLVASIVMHPELRFHVAYQAAAMVLWTAVAVTTWHASKEHHVLDNRPLFTTAAVVYFCSAYVYVGLYVHPRGFERAYVKVQLWTAVLELVVVSLLSVAEYKRVRAGSAPDGYETLPDVEAGTQKKKRTWVSLFLDACWYVWPESVGLKARVLVCLLLLISMRFLNIAVPVINKYMVNKLARASEPGTKYKFMSLAYPWVFAYLVVMFFQGGAGGGVVGFINNLRQFVWIPVSQDTYRRVSLAVFTHVLNMDLNFHLKRKTGEVTKVVDRGTAAIQNVLSTLVFSIGPQIIDVLIAATYLATALDPWIALIVFVTIGSYIPLTVIVTEWRGSFRRDMNTTENAKSSRVTDALLNWETVKYFCNEAHEEKQFANSIDAYQLAEYRFISSLNILNVVQSAVMFTGMSAGLLVSVRGVAIGEMTVGDVVLFLTLMAQLYAPLNFFGTYYRIIQQYMIDMENLFELLDRNSAIPDAPDALPLQLTKGEVEFRDVIFSYEPGRDVLQGVNFKVPGGSTIAFVGATGSGKSTLTRLLFRFYDVKSGLVLVDGQPLPRMTQASLRRAIGMVPQDCILFNDTIRHNIRYGRLDATDEEVEAAAEAACIHGPITERFPNGYNTVVGERGLRLSGGEKQRVAFARALLKNPAILVLDEATSALDSITEKKIQIALREARERRTTLVVAHRLSTIMDADCICVMADGRVVENGTHQDLLAQNGLYTELWSKQLSQQENGTLTPVGSSPSLAAAATASKS